MTDSRSETTVAAHGTSKLEQALVTIETKLDGIFEANERSSRVGDESRLILEQLLDLIYESFSPQIPYDRIGLAVVENNGEHVRSRWVRSESDSLTMGSGEPTPVHDAAVQLLLGDGRPSIVDDLQARLEEHDDSGPIRFLVEEGTRSSLTCPLFASGKPTGVMVFSSKRSEAYAERHRAMVGNVAAHVAAILERSRLYERLGELNWELRVARDALEYQAAHDGLTRLLNHSAILRLAASEMGRAHRQGKPITIVMCDVDHFKKINDSYGHRVGDEVLQAIAARLEGALRSYESVGRYGGEEFLITLTDCDAETAPHAMERLRTAVGGTPIETSGGAIEVSISLGAAAGDAGGEGGADDLDSFIRIADEALYEAKEAGRDRYCVRRAHSSKKNA